MKRSMHDSSEIQLRHILKNRRTELGISQKTLAMLMGRNRTFITKYEQGETFLLFTEVVRICRLLSLDINALADLIDPISAEDPALEAAERLRLIF